MGGVWFGGIYLTVPGFRCVPSRCCWDAIAGLILSVRLNWNVGGDLVRQDHMLIRFSKKMIYYPPTGYNLF